MRILFLDDDDNRHNMVRERLSNHDITHVHTVQECIDQLRAERYDLVSLDHDLDLTHLDDKGNEIAPEETGQDVCHFIALHLERDRYPNSVIIHSHNPDGAKEMSAILKDTGIPITMKKFWVA